MATAWGTLCECIPTRLPHVKPLAQVKARESQVNMKALEKAEAKLKAKLEKRNARSLYEGSKLMQAQQSKKSYEELFLEVNPLQAVGSSKGKSKDIHIEGIDVSSFLSLDLCACFRGHL